jgi:predicted PurR-regulated permease PerM
MLTAQSRIVPRGSFEYHAAPGASMERVTYARAAFVAVFAIVAYYVFRIVQPFLVAIIWAAILATVFYPVYHSLAKRW